MLCQGRIIWARVVDPQGREEKLRPLVIIMATTEIPHSDPLVAVALSHTTALTNPLPPLCVKLPYHPNGMCRTKLRKETVAICNWLVAVKKESIVEMAGVAPPGVLLEIIQKATGATGEDPISSLPSA